MTAQELRADFGANLEANYQQLVAQLYAITLDADRAHECVQDAYSRAWRDWARIGRSPDPTGWVRTVAVRSTIRPWLERLARLGLRHPKPPIDRGLDARTTALLTALRELAPPERRSVVMHHMVGLSRHKIAAVERVPPSTIHERLGRGRWAVLAVVGASTSTGQAEAEE
jgi:DNA-directed RNA polymerase specialized sigma24 family protein